MDAPSSEATPTSFTDETQDRLSQRNRCLSGKRHMRAQSMFRAVPVDCTAAPYTGRGPARPTPFYITHRWLAVMPFLGASQWTSPSMHWCFRTASTSTGDTEQLASRFLRAKTKSAAAAASWDGGEGSGQIVP